MPLDSKEHALEPFLSRLFVIPVLLVFHLVEFVPDPPCQRSASQLVVRHDPVEGMMSTKS